MEGITKFFSNTGKKRDRSNDSKDEYDDSKRVCENLESPSSPGDDFTEALKSPECAKILVNCMKNLEKEMNEIREVLCENQSRGDQQIKELADSITFLAAKYDESEKIRKEKEKELNDLKVKTPIILR